MRALKISIVAIIILMIAYIACNWMRKSPVKELTNTKTADGYEKVILKKIDSMYSLMDTFIYSDLFVSINLEIKEYGKNNLFNSKDSVNNLAVQNNLISRLFGAYLKKCLRTAQWVFSGQSCDNTTINKISSSMDFLLASPLIGVDASRDSVANNKAKLVKYFEVLSFIQQVDNWREPDYSLYHKYDLTLVKGYIDRSKGYLGLNEFPVNCPDINSKLQNMPVSLFVKEKDYFNQKITNILGKKINSTDPCRELRRQILVSNIYSDGVSQSDFDDERNSLKDKVNNLCGNKK